ncbi:uncharacterized protein BDV14DRAFT_202339 [Aspergillus stella-maris]|uniref:uncharacterized protein n=1 Tax=Aspergillus stella-maris TaxID=1810926 RepID=UPI003CCD1CE2
MSPHNLDPLSPHALFARAGSGCKECPSSAPTCNCPSGTKCMMTAQSCSECASVSCVTVSSSSSSDSSDSSSDGGGGGSNTGAIAGGVIGGVAAIAILTFLIWWFVIRKKREQQRAEESEKASSYAPSRMNPSASASAAQSRKSTHSIASTVLTRASNVIQIAYIPGVTNRSPPDTPLVPPVPPLPGASADQHFFMPGDLRDSSWSDMSQDRRSMANTLRSSVATTIYRNDAIVSPMPAQQITRARANVVSVHNGGSAPTTAQTTPVDAPAVPAITTTQLAKAGVTDANNNSSIVGRAVTAKPVMVKTLGKKNTTKTPVQPIAEQSESSTESSSTQKPSSSSSNETFTGAATKRASNAETPISTTRRSQAPTVIEDSPAIIQSPFNDQPQAEPETASASDRRSSAFLDSASLHSKRHSGAPPARVESPFADTNEVK